MRALQDPLAHLGLHTVPLGLAVPGSDIDVACYSPTLEEFLTAATDVFGQEDGFATRFAEWVQPRAAIADAVLSLESLDDVSLRRIARDALA